MIDLLQLNSWVDSLWIFIGKTISRLKAEIDFYLKRLQFIKREIDQPSDDNWSKEAKDLLDAAKKSSRRTSYVSWL